jgi:hypothetical protein
MIAYFEPRRMTDFGAAVLFCLLDFAAALFLPL